MRKPEPRVGQIPHVFRYNHRVVTGTLSVPVQPSRSDVTHWTFANCEVRVIGHVLSFFRFSGRSLTVFRPMARVPRNMVRSLAPKPKIWILVSSRIGCLAGLYRYKVVLVPVQSRELANPSLGLHFRRSCTGAYLRLWASYISTHALGLSPGLRRVENQGRSLQAGTPELAYATMFARAVLRSLRVEWDRHIPRVGMSGYHRHLGGTSCTTFEPSTQGEARDRGKGVASS
uniref:Uncharacterized protein n=1 Tax=Ananas comosus var. bracteatus TaxID=296719 RepID=A0A6V7QBP4_ANACO|nr:unnamed protein product [Ananas comosus var. bracteatus]